MRRLAGLDSTSGDQRTPCSPRAAVRVYNAMADNRLPGALEDYRRMLGGGDHIVGSGPVFLQYPWRFDEIIKFFARRCARGNSSLWHVNGIDPGSPTTLRPMALAGTCEASSRMRCMEIADYATYDNARSHVRRDGLPVSREG